MSCYIIEHHATLDMGLNSKLTLPSETYSKEDLRLGCKISSLSKRRDLHLLLLMHKERRNIKLLKPCTIVTRLHTAIQTHLNEKARLNLFYRGAQLWNGLPANVRNMNFKDFKTFLRNELRD